VEDYCDDVEMPGSRLNKVFFDPHYGDGRASEQTFITPFGDGDNIKYFVVRGLSGGDRRVTRCGMVRIMNWGSADRLSRGCLGGDMGRHAIQFKLKAAEVSSP
jgi:hypothetical protein